MRIKLRKNDRMERREETVDGFEVRVCMEYCVKEVRDEEGRVKVVDMAQRSVGTHLF